MATTTAPQAGARSSGSKAPRSRDSAWSRRLPLLPALVFMVVMTQLPFLATLVISTLDWNSFEPGSRSFALFDNYVTVFTTPRLLEAVINTVFFTVAVVGVIAAVRARHRAPTRPQVLRARDRAHAHDRALPGRADRRRAGLEARALQSRLRALQRDVDPGRVPVRLGQSRPAKLDLGHAEGRRRRLARVAVDAVHDAAAARGAPEPAPRLARSREGRRGHRVADLLAT